MKIKEIQKKLGTLFIVEGIVEDFNNISRWLHQNDIQCIRVQAKYYEFRIFIRDETSIMAFKLRWL